MNPPGSFPGMMNFASAPATRPSRIQDSMPMVYCWFVFAGEILISSILLLLQRDRFEKEGIGGANFSFFRSSLHEKSCADNPVHAGRNRGSAGETTKIAYPFPGGAYFIPAGFGSLTGFRGISCPLIPYPLPQDENPVSSRLRRSSRIVAWRAVRKHRHIALFLHPKTKREEADSCKDFKSSIEPKPP